MDNNQLKLISALVVKESKLPKDAKLQLLNFIQNEATKHQLMVLLMDGKIDKIDENKKVIIEQKFNKFEKEVLDEQILSFILGSVMPAFVLIGVTNAVIALLILLGFKAAIVGLARKFSSTYKYCKNTEKKTIARQHCELNVKIELAKQTISILRQARGKCNSSKNPQKCVDKIDKSTLKLQTKIQELDRKIRYLERYSRVNGNSGE
jgi:hypothetical protein